MNRGEIKDWARENVKGIFFGNTTPFTADLKQVDWEALRFNLRHCVAMKAHGIGWGGPLAEPYTMSTEERKHGHEILAEEAKAAGILCYAYPVAESVPELIELVSHAASVGCDLMMVNVPFEWTKSRRMIIDYFKIVCDAAGTSGIMLYDTPHAGMMMPIDLMDELANLPNICTMKPGNPGKVEDAVKLQEVIGDRIVLSAGSADIWPGFAEAGLQFMPPTSAAYMMQTKEWQPIREIFELSAAGKYADARTLCEKIVPLQNSWRRVYSQYFDREFGQEEHPVNGIKRWIDLIGMVGGEVRPLTSPAGDQYDWMPEELEAHRQAGLLRIDRIGARQLATATA